MSGSAISPRRRLLLVDSARGGGTVLERALASRGWAVMRTESCTMPYSVGSTDAILLTLDGDDADAFELLLRLSSLPERPTVVLLTRRADALVLGREALAPLGVDRVARWPARIEQIEALLEAAERERQPEEVVS